MIPQRATLSDYEGILEVANTCFGNPDQSAEMELRWPHCYQRTPEDMRQFFVVKNPQGKVVSCLRYVDEVLLVDGNEIKVAGISGVSTLPEYRGQGHMSALLSCCIPAMREERYALAELGGNRTRYGRYGWELAGRRVRFVITARSMKGYATPSGMSVRPFGNTGRDWEAIFRLHREIPWGLKRSQAQYETLFGRKGWETRIAEANGEVEAYVVVLPSETEPRVDEFGGKGDALLAILAELAKTGARLQVNSPWECSANADLFRASDMWSIAHARMVKVLDLRAVLEGFKGQIIRKAKGSAKLSLAVNGEKEATCVNLAEGECDVSVESVTGQTLVLDEMEMVRFLFGSHGPLASDAIRNPDALWSRVFPLDFFIWNLESV